MTALPASRDSAPRLRNHHCSVVEIEGIGVMIEGGPGSGKSSLALGLLEYAGRKRWDAALVCDDQALMEVRDGAVIASPPEAIAGKIEIRGFGIAQIAHRPSSRIGLIVRIVEDEAVPRMPRPCYARRRGVSVPLLTVPRRHESAAVRIIAAWLGQGQL